MLLLIGRKETIVATLAFGFGLISPTGKGRTPRHALIENNDNLLPAAKPAG